MSMKKPIFVTHKHKTSGESCLNNASRLFCCHFFLSYTSSRGVIASIIRSQSGCRCFVVVHGMSMTSLFVLAYQSGKDYIFTALNAQQKQR